LRPRFGIGCSKSVSDFKDEGLLARGFQVEAVLVLASTREADHG
jgi:hypothetical protein